MKVAVLRTWIARRISPPRAPGNPFFPAVIAACTLFCPLTRAAENDWRSLIERREWAEAAIALKPAVGEGGIVAIEPALALVRAWTYLGRREEALTLLQRLIAQPRPASTRRALRVRLRTLARQFLSQEVAKLHQNGADLLQAGKAREALAVLEQGLKKEPFHVDLLVRIAQCRYFLLDFESAREALRTARSLLPDDAEIETWFGRVLFSMGDLPQARKELEAAIKLDPDFDVATVSLADVLVAQGAFAEAIRVLGEHSSRRPMDLAVLLRLARIRGGNVPRAGASVRDAAEAKKLLRLTLSRAKDWRPVPEEEYRYRPWDLESLQKEAGALLAEMDVKGIEPSATPTSG